MSEAPEKKHRIYAMSFASVYPHYIAKAEKKGRSKAEVDEIVRWLTGYTQKALDAQIKTKPRSKPSSLKRRSSIRHAR